MEKIDLKNAWKELNERFTGSIVDLLTLPLLTRLSLEKEGKNKKVNDAWYSSMHKMLHWDTIETSMQSFYNAIYSILINEINDYEINNIIRIIGKNIKGGIKVKLENTEFKNKKYDRLEITSVQPLEPNKNLFFYHAKRKNHSIPITFISNEILTLKHIYSIEFSKKRWIGKVFYFLEEKEDLFYKEKKNILDSNSVDNVSDLVIKMANLTLYNPITHKPSRKNFMEFHAAALGRKDIKEIRREKYLPFFMHPLIANLPIGNIQHKYVKLFFENIDPKLYNEFYFNEYLSKMEADMLNLPYIQEHKDTSCGDWGLKKIQDKYVLKKYDSWLKMMVKIFKYNPKNMIEYKSLNKALLNEEDNIKNFINIFNKNNMFLTAPAGYGKSYIVRKIIGIWKEQFKDIKISLICPTWKAISVYEDEVENYTVSKLNDPRLDPITKYRINSSDFIIIDEVSMIEDWSFLEMISDDTRVIFLGDNMQLTPVGKNMPSLWLEKISFLLSREFRLDKKGINKRLFFDGNNTIDSSHPRYEEVKSIDTLLRDIRKNNLDLKGKREYSNLISINNNDYDWMLETIKKYIEKGYRIITKRNTGILGVTFLNKIFSLNGDAPEIGERISFTDNKDEYYNGMEGVITKISDNPQNNELIYEIETSKKKIQISSERGNEPFKFASVITAHRAQGSSIDKILVINEGEIDYRWLYTAASRVKEKIHIAFINYNNVTIEYEKVNIDDDFIKDYINNY